MRKNTILLSISIGTLVYVLISLFCGQNGLWAESQLASQKMDLCNNIAQIQKINDVEKAAIIIGNFVLRGDHQGQLHGFKEVSAKYRKSKR